MEDMQKNKKVAIAVAMLVMVAIGFLVANYVAMKNRLAVSEGVLQAYKYNNGALSFTRLFIEKVLEAEGEVSFEDRLQLENQMRDLKDAEVTSAWNAFTQAQTEMQAQTAVKKLLKLLIGKVQIR
jgi:hypothetical protein